MLKLRFWIFIILLFIPASIIDALENKNNIDDSPFVIRVNDNLLTAKVKNVSLKKVLNEIANQIPVKIALFAPAEELLVANFSRLPIEKGLKQLFRNFNYALIYDRNKSKKGEPEIRKVIILSRKEESQNSMAESDSITFTRESSRESIMKSLKNKDSFIREDAVDALGSLRDESDIELLSGILFNDRDEDVRASAADALASIGTEEVIDSLNDALNDESVDVRVSATDALGDINGEAAIDALKKALHDEDEEVREAAVDALEWIGGDRAIQTIKDALSDYDEGENGITP